MADRDKTVETRLMPFSKLSPARQEEIRRERKAELAAAEKDRYPDIGDKVSHVMTEYSPFTPSNIKEKARRASADRDAARERRYQSAARNLQDLDKPDAQRLYADDKPHKVNPDTPLFSKGGRVSASKRADGIAKRGKTRGKMV